MIIIGDSLVQDVVEYTVNSYSGITILEYLKIYNELQEDEDVIIYSLGTNDDLTETELIQSYLKLKRGTKNTFIIIPPKYDFDFGTRCEDILEDDVIMIYNLVENYTTTDGLHLNEECLLNLNLVFKQIERKI